MGSGTPAITPESGTRFSVTGVPFPLVVGATPGEPRDAGEAGSWAGLVVPAAGLEAVEFEGSSVAIFSGAGAGLRSLPPPPACDAGVAEAHAANAGTAKISFIIKLGEKISGRPSRPVFL